MTAPTALTDRASCPGTRHGDRTAYKAYHCRCPDARLDKRRHDKARAAGLRPAAHIPVTGTVRRLQALAAIGWDGPTLANRLHVELSYLQKLRGGGTNPTITRGYAQRVADLYEQLSGTPGPSSVIRTYAARFGWAAAHAWYDIDIDDPDARPDRDGVATLRGSDLDWDLVDQLTAGHIPAATVGIRERTAAVHTLTAQGMTAEAIAERTRMSERTVIRLRGREAS